MVYNSIFRNIYDIKKLIVKVKIYFIISKSIFIIEFFLLNNMGGIAFCGYTCSKVKTDNLRTIRPVNLVDLPNYVDPSSIQD